MCGSYADGALHCAQKVCLNVATDSSSYLYVSDYSASSAYVGVQEQHVSSGSVGVGVDVMTWRQRHFGCEQSTAYFWSCVPLSAPLSSHSIPHVVMSHSTAPSERRMLCFELMVGNLSRREAGTVKTAYHSSSERSWLHPQAFQLGPAQRSSACCSNHSDPRTSLRAHVRECQASQSSTPLREREMIEDIACL